MGYKGEGVVVCIFDTGMRKNHEAWWNGPYEYKWRTLDPYNPRWEYAWFDPVWHHPLPHDWSGHGTHVGGIAIGGDGDPSGGIIDIGVAPGAKLIACCFFTGIPGIHEDFEWIVSLTATPEFGNIAPDVVNGSWGDDELETEFWQDLLILREFDIIPVFCIGNVEDANSPPLPCWEPGNYPITIAVGAVNELDNRANFSLGGPSPDQPPWNDTTHWSRPDWDLMGVDMMAPGTSTQTGGILSADKSDSHGYVYQQGTSMATPHVTGAVALMLNASLNYWGYKLDYYDIYNLLIESANPVGQNIPNYEYGWGRLDCKAAVDSVLGFHLKSSRRNLSGINQKKIVYDGDRVHLVYQTGEYIRYTFSDDNGYTWSLEEKVSDGEYPCISFDSSKNAHVVFKDGIYMGYCRRINGGWDGPFYIFDSENTLDMGTPSFTISGNTGYVVFERRTELGSELIFGTFDITSSSPYLSTKTLLIDKSNRIGNPSVLSTENGIYVVYTKVTNGIREVYLKIKTDVWRTYSVSNIDNIPGKNPVMVGTGDKVWIFWEEDEPSDIYYRIRTQSGWATPPSYVYQTPGQDSKFARGFYNTIIPEKIYISWSEYTNSNYEIYVSEYDNGWQIPYNISNTDVDSKYPDITFIASDIPEREGTLVCAYAEGNPSWLGRGRFLPIYRIRVKRVSLPLSGEMVGSSGGEKYGCEVKEKMTRFNIPFKSGGKLTIYDNAGRVVKRILNRTFNKENCNLKIKEFKKGVYFIEFERKGNKKKTKILIIN